MLHLSNTFEPPAFPSSSSSNPASQPPATFAFSIRRGWCQTKTVLGSVMLQEGNSVVSAIVHIVRPNTGKSVNFDRAVLDCEVSFASHTLSDSKKSEGNSSSSDKNAAHIMSKAVEAALLPAIRLDAYPKSIISIHVNILKSSAHDVAAAISAASLALVDAAVELQDIVLSVTLENQVAELGPSFRCVVAAMSSSQEVSYVDFAGEIDPIALTQLVAGCKAQCASLRASVIDAFRPSV